jgi:hypothetical protein
MEESMLIQLKARTKAAILCAAMTVLSPVDASAYEFSEDITMSIRSVWVRVKPPADPVVERQKVEDFFLESQTEISPESAARIHKVESSLMLNTALIDSLAPELKSVPSPETGDLELVFTNHTKKEIILPLSRSFGKGLSGSWMNLFDASTGFDGPSQHAHVSYTWFENGIEALTGSYDLAREQIHLYPKGKGYMSIPIKVPMVKGSYQLVVRFDNEDVREAIYSVNVSGLDFDKYVFLSKQANAPISINSPKAE